MSKKDIIDTLIEDWKRERPDLDATSMGVVGRLLNIGKTLEKRAGKALKCYNINYTDLDVMATLRRSGKPYELTPKDLMNSVIITSGALTTLLNRLEKLGFVYRSSDNTDARVKKAGLTEKGKRIIDRAIETRFEESGNAIKMLSGREKNELSMLLKKMMNSL